MTHAIAILTYVDKPDARLQARLDETLYTLAQSGYPGKVFVVDDGSYEGRTIFQPHLNLNIHWREVNGGISKGKNTCLRLLKEENVEVGFLADDDLHFHGQWWEPYLEAHACTNVQHFSWALQRKGGEVQEVAGHPVVKTEHLNGCLLTFTPEVLEKVGGFEVTPLKWGWDHVNWTNRIVACGLAPFYADVVDSNQWVSLNRFAEFSSVSLEQRREGRNYNFATISDLRRELVE